jgi:CBS-domain-containing membrane protein
MSQNLETLSEQDTIARAAAVMASEGVGFLPVLGADNKVIGVVTDRDVVTRGVAKGMDPATTSAAMIMSSPALTCLADADLRRAEELMASERKGRIIVTDEDGTLAGVISVVDLIEHAPERQAIKTAKAVLWREALGPRGGAAPGTVLLRDVPIAPAADDETRANPTVFTGGRHDMGSKEFPS